MAPWTLLHEEERRICGSHQHIGGTSGSVDRRRNRVQMYTKINMKPRTDLCVIQCRRLHHAQWRHYRVGITRSDDLICSPLSTVTCLILLRCHTPGGCHPGPFLPARPRFSTVLCKFSHNFFHSGVNPWMVSPGRSPLVTPMRTEDS